MNYKDAYLFLFNSITDVIELLRLDPDKKESAYLIARLMKMQCDAEDKCIEGDAPPILTILPSAKETGER